MNKNSFTIVSIILIVLLVVYSGNSTAFTMQVSTNKKVYFPNNLIEINTRLETEQLEFVEIENITIQIVGMDEHNSNLKSVCVLKNLDDTEECSREDERFVSVIISRQDYGYGYYGYGYEFNGVLDIKILWLLKDWITGNYSVMFSATVNGEEYHTNTTIQVRERLGKIAFICRTDACNYNKEPSIINFLTDNGWIVEGKGYWSWGNEIRNYKLIVCADQLKACKIDGSHPAYWAHKAGVAFLELADQPYVNAGWRFGYTKGYVGLINDEDVYITAQHKITEGFSGFLDVMIGSNFAIIPDYMLSSSVIDLADSGNRNSSTLFVSKNYAYVGWFNENGPESLTENGATIFNRVLEWLTREGLIADEISPKVLEYAPIGDLNTRKPLIKIVTDKKTVCRFSLNVDKPYEQMEFEFPYNYPVHEYQLTFSLPNGTYTVFAKCKDLFGNYATEVSWVFKIDLPVYKDIAFICRTDACNYGIEREAINWLEGRGWTVEGKGYWSWGNEIRNYKLIVCADQLKACKIDGSHPAYWAHKADVAFLELADQPYVNAGWRFGYTKGYIGNSNSESLHITGTHYITQNFSGAVNVLPNTKFAVIPDYMLSSSVIDLADSGNRNSSTLFVSKNYAYVGWFGAKGPMQMTTSGNLILNKIVNWLIK